MQVHLIGGRACDVEDMDMDAHLHNHVGFSQRRNASLQRSQDSGALTDWSAGSRASPTRQSCHSLEQDDSHKYVTVLSVNGGLNFQRRQVQPQNDSLIQSDPDDFVTVLSIGSRQTKNDKEEEVEEEECEPVSMAVGSVCLSLSGFVEEVACVTRRPGQKLGFGLKFDGGNECDVPIQRLFVQCCAEGSPASKVRCSWGRLVEADEIIEIDGVDIRNALNRLEVVSKLKDGQDVLSLKIRHYWDESKRIGIMEQLNRLNSVFSTPSPAVCHPVVDSKPPVTRKMSTRQQQERAVDVPEELLTQSVVRTGQRPTAWKGHPLIDEPPPPVPPRRKRRSKLAHSKSGATSKTIICRSLSSDEVLVNGNRVTATGAVTATTPSKPPRNHRPHSRSFNATHSNNNKDDRETQELQAPATLPRTKEFIGQQLAPPEPKERTRRNTLLTINADWCAPQPAEVYTNLIAEEDKRLMSIDTCSATESESESSSSVSTVVDNWSVVSSTSGGDPFGDFSEQEEYREFSHQPADEKRANQMIIEQQQQQQQLVPDVVAGESTLSVLIEPPETFLDEGPTSISPTLSSEDNLHHQDASSDSGASSGGSELHLGESDEELRAFQQMENALETEKLEQTRNAISDATMEVETSSTSGAIERPEAPIQQSAICVPDVQVEENNGPAMECQAEKPVKRSSSSSRKEGVHSMNKKSDLANGNSSNSNNKNRAGSKLNLNRTPLRSKIPQAVSTPPPATRPASAIPSTRNGRPLANNRASNIVGPKVVNKTSTVSNSIAVRQQNHYNSSIQSSRMLSTKTTPTISQQRIGSNETKSTVAASSSTNLLKSVKPGLPQATTAIHGSRIPRPSSSSGGQPAKSSPSAATARLASHASSSSSAMLAAAHRHPSSPSLLLQANNRTTTTTSGVKSCIPSHLHKSTSRLQLTHNKGESSLRSDLVSAH
ncbi:serine-rich adhesin for platelets-like [Daphnia carinata]|uniref:serine-rich adhesin for platelets-like n=1 Tax=Daphnia carinata TaxID=120202 RepID=UPI00286944BA|nr:serine-rich adhesin for platelets-like [Daphnia carinata]